MNTDVDILKKHLIELARRASGGSYFTFSDFLGLAEQSALSEIERELNVRHERFGGAEGAERVIVRFGDEEEIGYSQDYPISCIKIEPVAPKFAEKLTHRDFLGALLNLGIERSVLGDIIVNDSVAYVFALEDITEYIVSSLFRVKHTDVKLSVTQSIPEGELYRTEPRRITAEGERLDAVIAKVYFMSRGDAQSLFKKRLVFVDGRMCESPSYRPKADERISVRGLGRMIYRGASGTTKKGKLAIAVDVYV